MSSDKFHSLVQVEVHLYKPDRTTSYFFFYTLFLLGDRVSPRLVFMYSFGLVLVTLEGLTLVVFEG